MRFYLPILTVSAFQSVSGETNAKGEKSRVGAVESAMAMMLGAPSATIFPAQNEQFVNTDAETCDKSSLFKEAQ